MGNRTGKMSWSKIQNAFSCSDTVGAASGFVMQHTQWFLGSFAKVYRIPQAARAFGKTRSHRSPI